jgi:hypothetical protein
MPTRDLLDISHHNEILSWADVPHIPIVHKVNEGTAIDRRIRSRMPVIESRTEIFGGYTVLIVSQSTIRQQIEQYASIMNQYWRDGAFTQLDVEPWARYPRPVNSDEIDEAIAVHDEIFGVGRCCVYINPNQMPREYGAWRASNPSFPMWLPDYSRDGHEQAVARDAFLWQWTSRNEVPGFRGGIDANEVLDPTTLRFVAGLDQHQPQPPPTGGAMIASNLRLLDTRGSTTGPIFKGMAPTRIRLGVAASAVGVNLTIRNTRGAGYLVAWPEGARPETSMVNWDLDEQSDENFAFVGVASNRSFLLAVGGQDGAGCDVIVDMQGYVPV